MTTVAHSLVRCCVHAVEVSAELVCDYLGCSILNVSRASIHPVDDVICAFMTFRSVRIRGFGEREKERTGSISGKPYETMSVAEIAGKFFRKLSSSSADEGRLPAVAAEIRSSNFGNSPPV